ncbi:hypothetical protein BC835DRAFT_1516007 [Cytidiella melzeri]|nr:hypothetical protein BC835DRAFT_1516007 [Cytidiella melzeri]
MFKFDFEVDEDPEIDGLLEIHGSSDPIAEQSAAKKLKSENPETAPFIEHTLDSLLEALPNAISFSPVHIPVAAAGNSLVLARRDLYDARFQLLASSDDQQLQNPACADLEFVEAPSDLVPGVYEGGLKTWECSVDLAAYLHDSHALDELFDVRILELGCGTAIPSMCLLSQAFSRLPNPKRQTLVHFQDYNELVFRLAVLPNLILTWYMSPASSAFRESTFPTPRPNDTADDDDDDPFFPPCNPSQPGDLPLTPNLLSAFRQSLKDRNVEVRFFSGSWKNFDLRQSGGKKYDLVLTSETIYRVASLPSLLDLMWQAANFGASLSLETLASKMSIVPVPGGSVTSRESDGLCLVAAKLVYFGVGGSVAEFREEVEGARRTSCARHPGTVDTVWKQDEGVKRVIMRVRWK